MPAAFAALGACAGASGPTPLDATSAAGPGAAAVAGAAVDEAAAGAERAVEAWRREVGPSLFAAPRLAGRAVLAVTGHGEVVALEAGTGERLWRNRLDGPLRGLVVRGGSLYTAADRANGRVFALDLRDGASRWSRSVGAARHAPAAGGDRVFVAVQDGTVYALDARTGATVWRASVAGTASAPPLAWTGAVLVATRADTLFHLSRESGEVTGRTALPATVSAPALVRGGVVFLPLYSGTLAAYDAASRQVSWSVDLGAPILAAPVAATDGDVFVLTRAAEVWRVDPATHAAHRVASLDGAAVGALTLAGDRLYVGLLDGTLLALRTDGTELWRERLGDSIVSPVAVGDGAVFAPLLRGRIVRLEEVR